MTVITSIGDARTPATPVEVTFAADTGQPNANQELLLFGRVSVAGGTVSPYVNTVISNSGDPDAAWAEAKVKFGGTTHGTCEIADMVKAAVAANVGGSIFPQIKCIGIANGRVDYGAADEALVAAKMVKAEFIVTPYDAPSGTLYTKLKDHVALVSGAARTANNQFGSFGVLFNRTVVDPATLNVPDTQYIIPLWLRDAGSPTYVVGEMAAACAAKMAGNAIPFNPLDGSAIAGVAAPADAALWPSVGDNSDSETALQKGWTPLYVQPSGDVAFVRTITSRLSVDGSGTPVVSSYFDVQDFQVLYYYRKTLYTRFSQPDFKKKASANVAKRMKAEAIRLAQAFEDQEMFQAVAQLAKQFIVQRTATDRSSFECKTPVNVVPGLHRKKINIEATTEFDTIVV